MVKRIFDREEWAARRAGLTRAEGALTTYREQPKGQRDSELLVSALRDLWKFAEYTLNALLETSGADPHRGHDMGQTALRLQASGLVQVDYSHRLEQLEKYRLKSDYGSYSREKSVNKPTAKNLTDCLESLRGLEVEAELKLREAGFLE